MTTAMIISLISGFLGAAAGISIYEIGKRQGYKEGYDKADSFHKSNSTMFADMSKLFEKLEASRPTFTQQSYSHSDNSK